MESEAVILQVEAEEKLSRVEERFERFRKTAGLWIAPAIFLLMLATPIPGLKPEAHRLAAVMGAVVTLWITEALPLPLTAMLGAAVCVVLRVAPAKDVFAPFADPLMFMFIGSFILARGIFLHGVDRRLAFAVLTLPIVGGSPTRVLIAFGLVTAFMSGWIANTAVTAMMFGIALSIINYMEQREREHGEPFNRAYATGLMLMTTFAASVGGLATPIGTAPNLIGLGHIRQSLGVTFPFFKWCIIGVPVVVVLVLWLSAYMSVLCRAGVKRIGGGHEMLVRQRRQLGPWTPGQVSSVVAFGITALLWVIPGLLALFFGETSRTYRYTAEIMPEGVAAILGASLLFLLPGNHSGRAITWSEASKIDWGVVFLYGGGFALGVMSFNTGLAKAVGEGLTSLLPVAGNSFAMLIAATVVACLVSETTSNTASANMVVPVVIMLARSAGVDPLEPALGATFGSSLGFMLPVSTPCNAIVYGSGYIPITRMIKYGVLLDVVGIVVIVTLVRILVPLLR